MQLTDKGKIIKAKIHPMTGRVSSKKNVTIADLADSVYKKYKRAYPSTVRECSDSKCPCYSYNGKLENSDFKASVKMKVIQISNGVIHLDVFIDGDEISISPIGADEFVFKNKSTKEVLNRWENVLRGISVAIECIRNEQRGMK